MGNNNSKNTSGKDADAVYCPEHLVLKSSRV